MNELDFFDFTKEPGKELKKHINLKIEKPLISIITAYYNVKDYIMQTANCIFNQTFPFWEWIIVDDCSNDDNKKILKDLEKMDSRIKIFYNEKNLKLPGTRDVAISKASAEYIYILDPDDLIENTALETAYFAMKTHPNVTWVYSDVVGFGTQHYLWNPKFDTYREKRENLLCCNALIKKDAVLKVGGYSNVPKEVYEDWHLWLRMLANGATPLKMSYYSFWYRRHDNGVLSGINSNKTSKKNALKEIEKIGKSITKKSNAIQYPISDSYKDWSTHPQEFEFETPFIKSKSNFKSILCIFSWLTIGGADKYNLNLLEKLYSEGYKVTIVTTVPSKYIWRQKFEKYSEEIFDLTSFLDRKDWPAFVSYLIKSRKFDLIFQSNSTYGYYLLPWIKCKYPNIPIIDYIHMEEWYWRDGGYPRDSIAVEKYIDYTYTCSSHLIGEMKKKMNKKNDKIEVVYIGTEEDKFNPDIVDVPNDKELEKIKDKKIVIFPCRISEQKRPLLMVEILKELLKKKNDIAFLVVGNGKMLNEVQEKVEEYGLSPNIVFLDAKDDIRPYYKIAEATLICSMIEGISLTAYESLAMGVPVITSDVGGQNELVDNDNGRVVKLCQDPSKDINNYNYSKEEINSYVNAIIEVMDNKKLKENCRKRILEKFTVTQMQEKMFKIIKDRIEKGTEIDPETIKNDGNIAERLVVMYNELSRNFYINPDAPKKTFKERFGAKMWKYKSYRKLINLLKKDS